MAEEILWSIMRTARSLSVHRSTIYKWLREDPNFPRPVAITKNGTRIGFRPEQVRRWADGLRPIEKEAVR